MSDLLRKDQLEASLHEEKRLIESGILKEDNPLDVSESFRNLCSAVRKGDIKVCQETITEGANINARDEFDYTPLILASLCGHYEIVQLLLESGALCERDTFQGERCLYNALTDRIRDLLLRYDYSKSTDPLQPFAAHITSLLMRDAWITSDIVVTSAEKSFSLHKFLLAARSPYFRRKLDSAPETRQWKLPASYPPQAFEIALRYLYLGELPNDVTLGQATGFTEEQILEGIDKVSRQLEIESLWTSMLENNNKRLARQHRTDETARGRAQLYEWFEQNVLKHKITVDSRFKEDVKWDRNNAIFADVLICADASAGLDATAPAPEFDTAEESTTPTPTPQLGAIPIGPFQAAAAAAAAAASNEAPTSMAHSTSVLFPAHRAILIRSEYFRAMFGSKFVEAQEGPHLNIVHIDYRPVVVEAILTFLYTERTDFGVDIALDVLFASDELLIERLKAKTAQLLSTLGNGALSESRDAASTEDATTTVVDDPIDPFAILDAAYGLHVPRLETFAARYFAYRLERFIDLPAFRDAVVTSAARIRDRQVTDSIELVDDIRYFLSERFRLRFETTYLDEVMTDKDEAAANTTNGPADAVANAGSSAPSRGDSKRKPLEQLPPTNADIAAAAEGEMRTLEGEAIGDDFASDAFQYQLLLGKIDHLLEKLDLDG